MTAEKREAMLEVACDLVEKVFQEECRKKPRGEYAEVLEDLMVVMRKIIIVSQKLQKGGEYAE